MESFIIISDLSICYHLFLENPRLSIADANKYFGKSTKKILTVLHKYGYHPYKMLPVQKLTDNHKIKRLAYCNDMLVRITDDNDFCNKILWSDEATFTTAGVYNRRNTHMWASENPHSYVEIKIQGRMSLNVWCGILRNRIIGPVIFNGSLTGDRYTQFLGEIEGLLEELPIREYINIIWHQDGAPPHNTMPVTNFLNNRFNEWIGTHGTINWPPNSPDLTPLDNFLWGYLKDEVYNERSQSLQDLRQRIQRSIDSLNEEHPEYIANALFKLEEDYRKCIENNGGHIQHL